MMSYLPFFMGLLGSLHCAVMCGPLMLALPDAGKPAVTVFWHRLLYQTGRLTSYSLLGLLTGLISAAGSFNGWQQSISVFTGIVLLILGCYQLFSPHIAFIARKQQAFMTPFLKMMGYWLYRPGGNFMAGMLNGFLPCGMVYLALASALNSGTPWKGAAFMLLFGMGTLPVMLSAGFAGSFLKKYIRIRFSAWLPFLFLLMGSWFVLRGSGLALPYLSPAMHPAITGDHCAP